ncbi:hypothetical protein [Phaeovulum sp.]|uniref:hypothetical protein n=1 Tax=Phaeovulum sp. TaxID=2934796 RepID=UPI0035661022
MPSFPFRVLTAAFLGFGLVAGVAGAQAPTAVEAPAPKAELVATASLSEGGPLLGPDVAIKWELFAIDANGVASARVATTGADGALAAMPGTYILTAELDMVFAAQAITLAEGMNTAPTLVLNAGLLQLTPELMIGTDHFEGGSVALTTAEGERMSYVGPFSAYVPAGELQVSVTFDAIKLRDSVSVAAGETVVHDFKAQGGIADVRISTGGFTLPEGLRPRIDIFEAPSSADAPLKMVVYDTLAARNFALPAGDYLAQGLIEGANLKVPFSISDGEKVSVAIELEIGMLKISAPEANSLALMQATDDPAEPWRMIFHQFDLTALEYIVPAGDYLIEAYFESGKVEKVTHVDADAVVALTLP